MSFTPSIQSAETPASFDAITAFLHSAAFVPLDHLGWIRVTGEDRVRWLNGMVTNNIAAMKPGEGCYTFFLNAQGRIQGDATAWLFEDFIILETQRDRITALMAMLDHFIIMDDVELTDISDAGKRLLLVAGPNAAAMLTTLGISPDVEPMHLKFQSWQSHEVEVAKAPAPIPSFEILADIQVIAQLSDALIAAGATPATSEAFHQLRILSGTPLYGTDIREKELPQETNQTRALHFSKGCYLGQEIVERIRSRGNVHRTFTGFILTGDVPLQATTLCTADAPDKPVGELTSITRIGHQIYALGYIRREVLDLHKSIQYPGGTATPASLPFPLPESRP